MHKPPAHTHTHTRTSTHARTYTGICIGKLALYCAIGGIAPHRVLPVVLDVGTNNQDLIKDPFYNGTKFPRLQGAEYYRLMDEFCLAAAHRWCVAAAAAGAAAATAAVAAVAAVCRSG